MNFFKLLSSSTPISILTVVNDDVDGPLLLDLKGVYYDVILKGKKATFLPFSCC